MTLDVFIVKAHVQYNEMQMENTKTPEIQTQDKKKKNLLDNFHT